MYQSKPKACGLLAFAYYALFILGFFFMGMLYEQKREYIAVYWLLFGLVIAVVWIRDKSFDNLGLGGKNLKLDFWIFAVLAVVIVVVAFLLSDMRWSAILRGVFYYLIRIALVEEVVFRGFLQSYLFGIPAKRKYIFLLGAMFFSLMHIPFQMYVNHMATLEYFLVAWPHLLFTFGFHLLMCFVTWKRGNILIPTVLHFALDFLQATL